MDWQRVYKGEAAAAADYLASLLDSAIKNKAWRSPYAEKYGDEWTERDEVLWAWKELQREMNHLDATTKEIPL